MNFCIEMTPIPINQFHIKTLCPKEVQDITNQHMTMDPNNYALSQKVKWSKNLGYQTCNYGLFNLKDELVGYMRGYYPDKNSSFWIQTFMIIPKYLRQGIGTYFFKMMIKHIQINSPLTEIYLTCYDANEAGISFWKSLGFNAIKHFTKSSGTAHTNEDYSLMKVEL